MAWKPSIAELYRQGVPLADASIEFAPESLVQAYSWACTRERAKQAAGILDQVAALRDPRVHASTKTSIAQGLRIDLRKLETDPFYNRDPAKYRRTLRSAKPHSTEYWRKMTSALITSMRKAKFRAVGFALPRTLKSAPVLVPVDLLASDIEVNWSTSEITVNGLTFVGVRIVPADLVDDQSDTGSSRGRESRKHEITASHDKLMESGKIKEESERQIVCAAVRADIIKGPADDWGLHTDTIWRYVKHRHRRRTK